MFALIKLTGVMKFKTWHLILLQRLVFLGNKNLLGHFLREESGNFVVTDMFRLQID